MKLNTVAVAPEAKRQKQGFEEIQKTMAILILFSVVGQGQGENRLKCCQLLAKISLCISVEAKNYS